MHYTDQHADSHNQFRIPLTTCSWRYECIIQVNATLTEYQGSYKVQTQSCGAARTGEGSADVDASGLTVGVSKDCCAE